MNIGDSYWGGGQGGADYGGKEIVPSSNFGHIAKGKNYLNKSLCDIPYRFSIEMINRGWIKRNTIIWHKPNCMPASADDRFTVDFEYLFFFTKNNKAIFWTNEKTLECVSKNPPGIKGIEGKDWEWQKKDSSWQRPSRDETFKLPSRQKSTYAKEGYKKVSLWTGHDYWFEQQFEEHTTKDDLDRRKNKFWSENIADGGSGKQNKGRDRREFYGKQGRNKRCVWTIPIQPFPEAHFAVYPEGLIEIPIKAGCPEFICKKCGKARVKIYENHRQETRPGNYSKYTDDCYVNSKLPEGLKKRIINNPIELGYSDCGCNAGFESGIVLDPFIGSGTTAKEALKQRKRFIGIDIKQEYVDMSYRKIARVQQGIF